MKKVSVEYEKYEGMLAKINAQESDIHCAVLTVLLCRAVD